MSLYVPFPDHKLRAAKISYLIWKGTQPSRPEEFSPSIGYIFCLLPVECIVVLIHGPIVDLQAAYIRAFCRAEALISIAGYVQIVYGKWQNTGVHPDT